MIRFVDISNQGIGNRFAFYDTITDRFQDFNGEMAWNNFEDFRSNFGNGAINRYERLCPNWVNDNQEDDVESWYKNNLNIEKILNQEG